MHRQQNVNTILYVFSTIINSKKKHEQASRVATVKRLQHTAAAFTASITF